MRDNEELGDVPHRQIPVKEKVYINKTVKKVAENSYVPYQYRRHPQSTYVPTSPNNMRNSRPLSEPVKESYSVINGARYNDVKIDKPKKLPKNLPKNFGFKEPLTEEYKNYITSFRSVNGSKPMTPDQFKCRHIFPDFTTQTPLAFQKSVSCLTDGLSNMCKFERDM
ncbi:MAG TPA: hypothetical protein VLE02_01900 [Nitrosarchaeum sp.]|nr:hypothetical protein [Nitrosarchaeum sp.]